MIRVLVGKFREHPIKVPESFCFFYWRVPNSFAPLRGTNSTTNYITGTANCNGNKDNFGTISYQGVFESIVINLYPDQTF